MVSNNNVSYYLNLDGIYDSFWVGKLVTCLVKKGKKKLITSKVNLAFAKVKYTNFSSPIIIYLELLEKIKPFFRFRQAIINRTKKEEYPSSAELPYQMMLAVHSIKNDILSNNINENLVQSLHESISSYRNIAFSSNK